MIISFKCIRVWWLVMLVISMIKIQTTSSFVFPRQTALFVNKISTFWSDIQKSSKTALRMTSIEQQITESNIETLIKQGPIEVSQREYLINGWRWHTASVIRDLGRFRVIVRRIQSLGIPLSTQSAKLLCDCCSFTIGFNWKALLRVENEIFFPWLHDLLPESAESLFRSISLKQASIRNLSAQINELCASLEKVMIKEQRTLSLSDSKNKLVDMEDLLIELTNCAKEIQYIQESVFVPYISAYVSSKDQERFNRMVISRLGLLDAQVHLVSMAEAVSEQPKEWKIFQNQIPKVAQLLIPVWRNKLYYPRTACLEGKGLDGIYNESSDQIV